MKAAGSDPAALASVIIAAVMVMMMVVMIPTAPVMMVVMIIVMMVVVVMVVLGEHPSVHALAVRPQIPRRSRLGGREQYGRVRNWLQQFSKTASLENFFGIGRGGCDLCRSDGCQNRRANHSS